MTRFPHNAAVVKIISGPGFKVAVIGLRIHRGDRGMVTIDDADNISETRYDHQTGMEIEPPMAGYTSELIPLDGQ